MELAVFLVNSVVVEKQSVAEVAAAHDVSRSWLYELLARYKAGGEEAIVAEVSVSRAPSIGRPLVWQIVRPSVRRFCVWEAPFGLHGLSMRTKKGRGAGSRDDEPSCSSNRLDNVGTNGAAALAMTRAPAT